MSQIVVYGVPFSPFVRKVHVFLREKGLAYENVPLLPRGITPELRQHTPLGKIPFARIGDTWLADSSIICMYVERKHPTPPLYPTKDEDYVRAMWFEEYIDAGAMPKLGPTIYFERVLAPKLMNRPTDEARVAKAMAEEVPPIYGYLDKEIGNKKYLAADRYTIADITVTAFFVNMAAADAAPDPQNYPNLARYFDEQQARPSMATVLADELQPAGA